MGSKRGPGAIQLGLFGEHKPVKGKKPVQAEMFETPAQQAELAQFGVRANPQISLSPTTKLALEVQDARTPDQRRRDEEAAVRELMDTLPGVEGDE
jgi:hypothetical protein